MENKRINYLSVDGGGVKISYSIRLLRRLEENDIINIYNTFDVFSGVSASGFFLAYFLL
jgi:patatin-like phospholipase/acyl hydrolase